MSFGLAHADIVEIGPRKSRLTLKNSMSMMFASTRISQARIACPHSARLVSVRFFA